MIGAARLAALVIAGALSGAACAASGPSVGNPLSPICDFVCDGTWSAATPPVPDQFVITYAYHWNPQPGVVSGMIQTTGGFAGVHRETKVTYGYDPAADALTVRLEVDDNPPLDGTVEVLADGYRQTVIWPARADNPEHTVVTTYRFPTADEMIVRTEISSPGSTPSSGKESYVRKPR